MRSIPVSRSARIQAGATGPGLEAQLAEHGLTLRHFPQSFEYATLGGWLATRAAGHFATVLTHIEDMSESIRAITPPGVWESRRLPGSGAGDLARSHARRLRGYPRRDHTGLGARTAATLSPSLRGVCASSASLDGVDCVRALAQSGLAPANCRLIDAREARITMAGDGSRALLVLGFESPDHAVDGAMYRALAICSRARGRRVGAARGGRRGEDAVSSWREAFLGAPYLRDSSSRWACSRRPSRPPSPGSGSRPFTSTSPPSCVGDRVRRRSRGARRGQVCCRFTHVYPDGPAPYFTVIAPARRGEEVEQWAAIKRAASDAIIAGGGTITHHHAVGRDHRPWYDRQRPEPFAAALQGAKAALDPRAIMNPGVLLDPLRPHEC